MTLSSSPGLEEFSDGIPPKKPDSTRRERILRIVIGILVVTTLTFATIQISQSELPGLVLGKGIITGSVLDSTGNPIRGEVFVIGTQNEVEIQPDGETSSLKEHPLDKWPWPWPKMGLRLSTGFLLNQERLWIWGCLNLWW